MRADTYGPDPTGEAEVAPAEEESLLDEVEDVSSSEAVTESAPDRASLARAFDELEAAKARVEKHAREVYDETRVRVIGELFPVLDNLDRTIAAAAQSGDAPNVLQGVRLVRSQLLHVLERYGIARFDAAPGERFDPSVHEAVSAIVVGHPDHDRAVVDQLEPGYKLGGKLLRPAKVVVGRYTGTYH